MRFWDNCSTFASEMDIVNLIKSSGARNFAKLLSANVLAQVIGLIVYPILTRIYSPEDFGLLNLFLSISGVLTILATAEYYNAIVLPKKESESISIVHVCMILLLLIVGLIGISVCFSYEIASVFKAPQLADYYWIMPILVFVLGGWNILNYWYIRCARYDSVSAYQLSQSILSAGGKLGFGYAGYLSGGMIYSTVLAPALSLCISIFRSRKLIAKFATFSWSQTIESARKYRNLPFYSLPRSFINMLAGQLPVLLLTPVFGSKYVGWWSMALLLGFIPISVITRSVYQIMYQYTTERVNNHLPIYAYFQRFTLLILTVGIPFFSILCYFMPDLTLLFLGEGWNETGLYLRWMLPWLLCSLLTSSTGFLADIFFKQKLGLGFEILTASLRTIGVILGVVFADFTLSIIGYALGSAIAVAAQYSWLLGLARKYDATTTS